VGHIAADFFDVIQAVCVRRRVGSVSVSAHHHQSSRFCLLLFGSIATRAVQRWLDRLIFFFVCFFGGRFLFCFFFFFFFLFFFVLFSCAHRARSRPSNSVSVLFWYRAYHGASIALAELGIARQKSSAHRPARSRRPSVFSLQSVRLNFVGGIILPEQSDRSGRRLGAVKNEEGCGCAGSACARPRSNVAVPAWIVPQSVSAHGVVKT